MSVPSGYARTRIISARGAKALLFLALTAGIFALIAVSINQPFLNDLDREATRAIQHGRTLAIDVLFFTASFLGNSLVLMLLCACCALGLLRAGHPRAAVLVSASLLSLPLNMLLKGWAVRPRPDGDALLILLPRVGTSFPSGHAMGSAVVYGFLAALVWMRYPPGRWRTFLTGLLALLPIPIGLSRIYVGAHWLSDVIAGLAAGAFLLTPLVALYRYWHRTPQPHG